MATPGRPASGYAEWRLIADELRREILDGALAPATKLASETELAGQFGVHRNTVRQAVAALAADDLVVARRGSGTFVADHRLVVHRIGVRTRLSESLGPRSGSVSGRLLASATERVPPAEVTERLQLQGRPALRLESVRAIDGLVITRATHWFDADRVPGIAGHFSRTGSVTSALRAEGIEDYVRAATTVGARLVTSTESADMNLPMGSVVLVVRAVDAMPDGTPLQYALTRFRADRVELDVEHQRSP